MSKDLTFFLIELIEHESVIAPKQAGISNSLRAIRRMNCKFWFHSSRE